MTQGDAEREAFRIVSGWLTFPEPPALAVRDLSARQTALVNAISDALFEASEEESSSLREMLHEAEREARSCRNSSRGLERQYAELQDENDRLKKQLDSKEPALAH